MTDKTKVISVRLPNETVEMLEKGGKTAREILTEYFEGGEKKSSEGKAGVNTIFKEIDSMSKYFGMTRDELIKGILDGLNDGYLTVENGKVVGVPEISMDRFFDACHERGLDPQSVLDKTTTNIEKGK